MNSKWYMVGGTNNGGALGTGEVYDPGADAWTALPNMNRPRAGHGLACCEGRLLAIGGFKGTALQSIETYDPREGKWELVRGSLDALPTQLDVLRPTFLLQCSVLWCWFRALVPCQC